MKRIKNMESYYNWARAVSPPLKNATNVEECECYIVKKDERWVTYARYYVYNHLCENHMIEHNRSVQQILRDNTRQG